ncbi:MAG: hypothetical protein GF350_09815, partial [Chitinivibrionales bacterium]|nr:hypothetical protein [Chitinivibrionales bacterium]
SAADESSSADVFETGNGFAGVWHLNETGTAVRSDATANSNDATPQQFNDNESIRGVIDGADSLENGEYLSIESNSSLEIADQLTLSAWVKPGDFNGVIFAKGLDYKLYHVDSGKVAFFANRDSGEKYLNLTIPIDTIGGWSYVTAAIEPDERLIYLNGTANNGKPFANTITTSSTTAYIGAQDYNGMKNYLTAPLDEIRVSSVARSSDWIRLCYHNQHPENQTLVTVIQDSSAPVITGNPQSQSVIAGETVTFSVSATGYPPADYQWLKDGAEISGATSATFQIVNVQTTDAGEYSVAVWNDFGSDTSGTVSLDVSVGAPEITVQPSSVEVLEGGTAQITITATGSEPLTYTWYKQSGGGVVGTGPVLTLDNVQQSMSGSFYYCIVGNQSGSDTSSAARLTVVTPVNASFDIEYDPSLDGLTVIFTDNSTGSINTRLWRFDDGSSPRSYSTKLDTIHHFYQSEGTYTCTLTVDGGSIAGTDRFTREIEYVKSDNPVTITARSLGASKAEIAFSNVDQVPTEEDPLDPAPWSTEIGLWYNASETPFTADPNPRWTFSIDDMLNDLNSGVYYATVNLPVDSLGADSAYFWNSPLWDKGNSPFAALNAAKTGMRPNNRLTLSADYLGNDGTPGNVVLDESALDSAVIYLENLALIDTPGISEIVVWYGFTPDDTVQLQQFAVDRFLADRSGSRYEWRIANPSFEADTQRVYAHQLLLGTNGRASEKISETDFIVGWPRPGTATNMYIDEVSATSIIVRWDAVSDADSIRVLYVASPDSIGLGYPSDSLVSLVEIISPASATDTSLRIPGLTSEKKYFIALQYRKNLLWTEITSNTLQTATTGAVDPTKEIENTARIDSVACSETGNTVIVSWTVQMQPDYELELAAVFGTDSLDAVTTSPDETSNDIIETIGQEGGEKSGTLEIEIGAQMQFEETYFIALWLRSADGPWAGPDSGGIDTVTTPSFTRQTVSYFTGDSAKTFNGKVVLFKDDRYTIPNVFTDTARSYNPEGISDDFIPVSVGFSLGTDSYQPLYIGIYYDSIPSGYDAGDIGMFKDSAGKIIADYNFVVDSARNFVYTRTSDFVAPGNVRISYIVLVDKKGPSVSFNGDTADAVGPDDTLMYEFSVDDNAANVRWRLLYARGENAFSGTTTDTGFIDGTAGGEVKASIPPGTITPETGVRALLIIEDGVHVDSVDVSRRALRDNSDVATSNEMQWIPLAATAELDDPSLEAVLDEFGGDNEDTWEYTPGTFRIFRWVSYSGNETAGDKWVEYSKNRDSLFDFIPGRVMWLKSRQATPFGLGPGATVSLKSPCAIKLAPQEWTDFALPFLFEIPIGDIIEATGNDADSLEFYEWSENEVRDDIGNSSQDIYVSEGLYIKEIPGLDDQSVALEPPPLISYTVYNRKSGPVVLKIPPTPVSLSSFGGTAAKKKSSRGWSIRVDARMEDGTPASPLYCGFTEKQGSVSYYSLPRSFSKITLGVYDSIHSKIRGHAMQHRAESGVYAYMLAFDNNSAGSGSVNISLERGGAFPDNLRIKLAKPDAQKWTGTQEPFSVDIAGHGREYCMMAVGTEDALDRFIAYKSAPRLGYTGCFPDPFARATRMYYTLPYSGIRRVVFEVFTMSGRKIWSTEQTALRPGVNSIEWRPGNSLAGGIFIISMQACKENGKIAARFKDKVMLVR